MDDDERTLKHLELIQGVINRLGGNSFAIKTWAVGIISAILVLGVERQLRRGLILIALVPALVFWLLDAYYLRQERLFRSLYDAVRANKLPASAGPFAMRTKDYESEAPNTYPSVLFSATILPLYLLLAVIVLGVYFIAGVS